MTEPTGLLSIEQLRRRYSAMERVRHSLLLLLLLLLLKEVGCAKLGASDLHPISAKTSAPQYQPVERKR